MPNRVYFSGVKLLGMKQQILVIHGGETFRSQGDYLVSLNTRAIDLDKFRRGPMWKDNLQQDLGNKYDIIMPPMPNANYAKYSEWKLWFERILPLLNKKLVLIGHSMGGIFLAKYLSENTVPNLVQALVLVAAPYKNMSSETLASFNLTRKLANVSKQSSKILLAQSTDDEVVEPSHVDFYKKELPNAELMIFKDKGHFKVEHFPELVEWLKKV